MTPDERIALFRARFGDGPLAASAGPAVDQATSFKNRMLGLAPSAGTLALDTIGHAPGIGAPITAARVADAGLGGVAPGAQSWVHDKALGNNGFGLDGAAALGYAAPGGPADLATTTRAAAETVTSPGGVVMRPTEMHTPEVQVDAAPTLDPRYGQIGRPMGGGGGMAGGTSAGPGLRARYEAAQRRQLGTLGDEMMLAGQKGMDQAARIEAVGSIEEQNAARMQADAERQQQIDRDAAQKNEAFISRNAELADELGKMRTDPSRLLRNADNRTQFTIGLGAVLGGALAGLNGGPNTSLARLDQIIDKDIRSQEGEIDNKKASLSARQSIFGQMLAETGDRRLASMQTRSLMYDAMKLKLKSDSDRLGIPEVRTNAELAINSIDQRQSALSMAMAKEALDAFQRQAAAAAAGRAAAEKAAWERSMQVFEMNLKQQSADTERLKAGKESHKGDDTAIQETTRRLADDDIVKNKSLIEGLSRKVDPKTGDIVGLSKLDSFRHKVAGAPGSSFWTSTPAGLLANATIGLGPEERIANMEFDQLALLYQTKVTGSGGSDPQMAKIGAAFRGAGTMEEKKRAIQMASDDLKTREGLAWGNLNDDQKMELQRRMGREGLTPMPKTVQVKAK